MSRTAVAIVGVVSAFLLAGCSSGPAGSTTPTAAAPAPAGADRFPVTITHAYGTTTVPAKPQRIVALGYNDVAVANAVGAPVVGAVRNYSGAANLPYVRTPLPEDVLGIQADVSAGVDVEKVASYRPDLILGVSASMIRDRTTYDRLSQIAYLYGQARGEILPMVVGEQNLSTAFMRSLGLRIPDDFRDAPASAALAPGTVGLSYEQVGMLDSADLLFMTFAGDGDRARFEGNALVQQLRPVREGHYLPLTLDQAVALQAPNVVSVGWLLDQLGPTLQKAADPGR